MDKILFQKKEYIVREVELKEVGHVLISTVSLNKELMNNAFNYISKEAQRVDESIYFYVEDNEITQDEDDFKKLISLQIL